MFGVWLATHCFWVWYNFKLPLFGKAQQNKQRKAFFFFVCLMLGYSGYLLQDKILDPKGCITDTWPRLCSPLRLAGLPTPLLSLYPHSSFRNTNTITLTLNCVAPGQSNCKGTSPIAAGIILSPFWYQNFSLFCPLLKIQKSVVWAGTATIQRI